ncbi:hypothetical protein ALC53_06214 [Atta colombica]|uniref:DUF4817 domain-containing protein n=1 Tax=Atta colombica TaxID=520822 RepID=A0A195BGL7_9HYME|nr:hypothetical protein ALC53_06214 [Atta colombica]
MPYMYSNSECADMVYLYGFCDRNVNAARHEYAARFPNKKLKRTAIILQHFDQNSSTNIRRSDFAWEFSYPFIWETLYSYGRHFQPMLSILFSTCLTFITG